MALRGQAVFGPGSRGSLDEAGAEGREAAALAAAGVALEDDEEDDGRRGLLRWDGFSAWLHCVCVVGFDLELGQAVEVIYPQHCKLTDKEVSKCVSLCSLLSFCLYLLECAHQHP